MPTGYTSIIHDGKEVTRNDFIMRCARAFGGLIMMRDEPLDAPIPESFEPNAYAKECLERAKNELERYRTMSDEEAEKEMNEEYQKAVDHRIEVQARELELEHRYRSLLDAVNTWNPPTKEHEELKRFCVKQLEESIEHDCKSSQLIQQPVLQTLETWRREKTAYSLREIAYYEKDWQEELKRTDNRNTWLKLLRESLKDSDSTE